MATRDRILRPLVKPSDSAFRKRTLEYGRARGGGPSGPAFLTPAYDDPAWTFTRASEAAAVDPRDGWAWYDLATPWVAPNVARVLPDGSVLIEEARTNLIVRSQEIDASPWSGNGSVTANDGTAPDGSSTSDKIRQITNTAPSNGRRFDNSAALNTGASVVGSAYVQQVTGGAASIQVGGSSSFANVTPGASWQRVAKDTVSASGAALILFQNAGGAGGTAIVDDEHRWWGAQYEAGAFATSPIRTSGAVETRGAETGTLASASVPAEIRTGAYAFDWSPEFASGAIPGTPAVLAIGSVTSSNQMQMLGTGVVRILTASGGVVVTTGALTWSAYQTVTFTVDASAGTLTVSGATTGDGTYTGTAWTWPTGDLVIGSSRPASGVYSRIWAAA